MNRSPDRPRVHVIIPSYNTAALLCRCLDSLRAQGRGPEREIYVVDNASSDDSVERVRQGYPEVNLLISAHNGGFAYAINRGLRQIRQARPGRIGPDFVLLLNSDTELPPGTLSGMVDFMARHPEAGMASAKLTMGDGQLDLACRRSFPTPAVALYRLLGLSRLFPRSRLFGRYNMTYLDADEMTEVDAICGAFMFARGEVVDEVGLLDEDFFMYGEDLDWCYRTKEAGWKIYYYPQVQVRHWKRASSRQRPRASLRAFYEAMGIFYRKHLAARYPAPLNWLVEWGISLQRELALAALTLRRGREKEGP